MTDGSRDTRSVSALSAAEQEGAGTDPDVRRTSSISILSSTHGRMRRAQRAIEKRDLQAALKPARPWVGQRPGGRDQPSASTGAGRVGDRTRMPRAADDFDGRARARTERC